MRKENENDNGMINIGSRIQKNNQIMIKIMIVLVVFSALSLLLCGVFQTWIKQLSDSQSYVADGRNILSEWVADATIAITDGSEMQGEMDASICKRTQRQRRNRGGKAGNP